MTECGAMPTIPEEDGNKPRKSRKPPVTLKDQTEDFKVDPASLALYLQELAAVDLRNEWERESDDKDHDASTSESPAAGSSSKGKEPKDNDASTSESPAAGSSSASKRKESEDHDASTSECPAAGSSSSKSKPKRRRTNKHKTYVGNRPPFVKHKPPRPGEVGYDTFVPEFFTVSELKDGFCAQWEYVFYHRMTWYARKLEDYLQEVIDPLPFGFELHRVVGAGARTCVADGMPGYLARIGVCTYKLVDWEWDELDGDRLVSVTGINKAGDKRTVAYVWNSK